MSALLDIYVKEETLETLLKTIRAKKEKGISLTISIFDESNNYGQNVTGYVSQSKEQREAGKEKFYVGNGKVFSIKDGIKLAKKKDSTTSQSNTSTTKETDDLPF